MKKYQVILCSDGFELVFKKDLCTYFSTLFKNNLTFTELFVKRFDKSFFFKDKYFDKIYF